MIGGIIVTLFLGLFSFVLIDQLKRKHPFIDTLLLKRLFFYHFLLALVYYTYASFNASDSKLYYQKVLMNFRGESWLDFYGTSTTFIEFVGYPFIKYLGFSYEAMMVVFSTFGFLGFIYFYIFFRENIRFRHQIFGFNLLPVIFFLPNLHFWSSSFGKGSIIFMGIGLFFYGISNIRGRLLYIIVGSLIIYHVRPHIMLVILVSTSIGLVFSTKRVHVSWRLLFLFCATVAFFFIYQDVLTIVGIDEDEFLSEGLDLTHRATELSKATSGVDITGYSIPMQVFTFLYRPLFFDAPGALGLIVSVENVFYLILTIKLLSSFKGIKFIFTGNFLVKSAFFSFITVSIALAQVSGNLGLAIRQKSQVMILFIFVIISFMDEQKFFHWVKLRRRKVQAERRKRLVVNSDV